VGAFWPKTAPLKSRVLGKNRHSVVGGSDARIIMGDDEEALLRLWREKRGEVEPKDLSGNLLVQLGVVTEDLNRRWYDVVVCMAAYMDWAPRAATRMH
jgi:predicted phage-related endonuclease